MLAYRPYTSLVLVSGLLAAASLSCVADTTSIVCPEPGAPIGKLHQKLVNGNAQGTFLAVSDRQSRAIGRVWPLEGPPGYFCSGVLVADRWVLTARHCNVSDAFLFEPGGYPSDQQPVFSSVQVRAHAERDVLLIELERDTQLDPIGWIRENMDESWLDAMVQLAGYGSDEHGRPSKELMFLVEPIVEMSPAEVVVSGFGRSGACIGDSGGPMLARDGKGRLVVAGVLSKGSASCRDRDVYVRTDVLRDWIDSHTKANVPLPVKCGDVSQVGFCRRGIAIWCAGDELAAEVCTDELPCGWSSASGGYRCVPSSEDACSGVDDLGICELGMARRCHLGTLLEHECEACGFECAFSPSTGQASCVN